MIWISIKSWLFFAEIPEVLWKLCDGYGKKEIYFEI